MPDIQLNKCTLLFLLQNMRDTQHTASIQHLPFQQSGEVVASWLGPITVLNNVDKCQINELYENVNSSYSSLIPSFLHFSLLPSLFFPFLYFIFFSFFLPV